MRRPAGVTLALLGLLLLAGCGAVPEVPAALAGLPLTHSVRGERALEDIARLHRRTILARDAFVAHYERDERVAMLYVSRAYATPLAWWQFSKMVQGIERGTPNAEGQFTHLKARQQDGLTVYSALGLGQVHYFYRSGPAIVWLAADPIVARPALDETLRRVR
ncbi:MAG: hypothetical protein A2W08_15745 [Candidatus Rokubacteria bacterium RBG_16_73_20]|nr:MAG: hypothetical protein A2050_05075 [Candidatus Rokubacteria bacterium GWA2_73_35]OGK95435.1 MAG: hypothetical protein A2W08_15745 [Candidatus Rokubacteria bacterium RBG_16_73_20]HBH04102.1 hypothetical protein [Candidatus Rokubacteria bacterium]